jgi:hypothetical protein
MPERMQASNSNHWATVMAEADLAYLCENSPAMQRAGRVLAFHIVRP